MSEDSSIRLNKFIAQQANIGRRAADELIQAGKVFINGRQVQLGARVVVGDVVKADGKILASTAEPQFLYVLMDKPEGFVCSRRQQGDTPTIYTLLPPEYQHLKTVGRLDKNSSGIIMLTNNGDLAHRLTHPRFVKTKTYEVSLDQPLQPLHHQMIADHGIALPDGPSKLQLQRLKEDDNTQWIVTMHEGRNRQIRRTFAALGYEVTRLHRTSFGPFLLSQLHGKKYAKLDTIPQNY
jgi:23S rRNA pseudouridine2605 synthase